MDRKIFDERGFLTKEGATFVNDGFGKELKRIMATATNHTDMLIISGILKSLIGEYVLNASIKPNTTTQNYTNSQVGSTSTTKGKHSKCVSDGQAIANVLSLLNTPKP